MNNNFTKLFSSIITSTIWREDDKTRIVWITMLAVADQYGEVTASIPGLAALANVTISECESALQKLMSPDPYSRTRDQEGRRIDAVEGGWRLLNHAKYRAMRDAEKRREYQREWDRQHRPSRHKRVKQSDNNPTNPTGADRGRPIQKQKQKQKRRSPYNPPKGDSQSPPSDTPAAKPKGKAASVSPDVQAIFARWNSFTGQAIDKIDSDNGQTLHVHWHSRKPQPDGSIPLDADTAIRSALKGFTVDDICAAIVNYAEILLSGETFWTHAWGLTEFFTRREGRAKDDGFKWWRFLPGTFSFEKYKSHTQAGEGLNLDGCTDGTYEAVYEKEEA